MRALLFSTATFVFSLANLFAAEVQVAPTKVTPTPKAQASATGSVPALPKFRPAMLGTGPLSVINRIDTQELIRQGQKDASISFCCTVDKNGEIGHAWAYRASPDSNALEKDLLFCLDTAVFVPAVYDHQPVRVLFYGTVTYKVVNGKPRLRIFANQEPEELKKESDFVGPQPFVGPGSKFEGLHYPTQLTESLSGIAEMAMSIDAEGNLSDLRLVAEHPPLAGFGRAAAEDFRVARFIPAFRDGKPVACKITLPVYYDPEG
jgi:hypothetical protein